MSDTVVKFTETVYEEKNKKGVLTPDENGYYTMVVGALNSYNSAGEFYTAQDVIQMFDQSSHFQRRIKSGALYGELGHPKKPSDMTMKDFYRRVITIEETNICAHFSEVWLDFAFGKNNPDVASPDLIAIMAKVKPAGAKANALQLALENPKQNAAFSIRGLTENKTIRGRVERRLTDIITFDHVVEPGIKVADKYMAPGLESHKTTGYSVREGVDTVINKDVFSDVLKSTMSSVGMESASRELYAGMLQKMTPAQRSNRLAGW